MNPASQNLQISVIIPNYNYAQFIGEAIESVLAQTVAPLEIIVGDDGSTEHSAAVVAQYADRVRYIQYPHSGETVVRTNLLHETRGEWVVMLDADDRLAPNYLEIMQEKIRAALPDDRLAFAYPDSECFGGRCGRIVRPEFDAQLLKKGNYIVVSSLVRADVARRFGFDSLFRAGQSDYDFFLTLASHGYRGLHVPEAILHYRIHSASMTSDVLRKSRQRQIMRRLLRKHRHFFTRDEARTAMTTATQRYWASLIEARSPFAGLGRRTLDLMRFVRAGLNHAELFQQALYALAPAAYHRRRYPPADVFYLFRDTVERRRILAHLPAVDLNRTQLFGFAELQQSGWSMDCNLRLPRISSVRETVAGWIERWYAPRAGVGRGDVMAVRAHLWQMNRAKVVVATTDNTGMPAARLKASGRLKAKLVYISVGLPERMAAVRKISPAREARYRNMLSRVDQFVAYGYAEAEWLREWLGTPDKVQFVPFGVDVEQWRPMPDAPKIADVVSVGADPQRDFPLLLAYARQHPHVRVQLVVGQDAAAKLMDVPPNVTVQVQLPVKRVQEVMAGARVLVLPVKENTYSGATTTLLQGMALEKAVAVSRVGAIRDGYGLQDDLNIRWLEPGSQASMNVVLNDLLARPEACQRLGATARRHVVEELSWSRYVETMRQCIMKWI